MRRILAVSVLMSVMMCCTPRVAIGQARLSPSTTISNAGTEEVLASVAPVAPDAGQDISVVWVSFKGVVTEASAKDFAGMMEKAAAAQPAVIVIEINSIGGDTRAGLDMAKDIERAPAPTICIGDGDVLSEGAFLLQACDLRLMTDRSVLMVHQPYLKDQYIDENVQKLIQQQQRVTWAWTQHVGRRWKITPDELRKRIAGGAWYMTGPEALAVGAIDAVIPDIRVFVKGLGSSLDMPNGLVLPKKD